MTTCARMHCGCQFQPSTVLLYWQYSQSTLTYGLACSVSCSFCFLKTTIVHITKYVVLDGGSIYCEIIPCNVSVMI